MIDDEPNNSSSNIREDDSDGRLVLTGRTSTQEQEAAQGSSRMSQEERSIMQLLLFPKHTIVEKRFTNDTTLSQNSSNVSIASPPPRTLTTCPSIQIPTEVLRQVTISGYLNYQDLGSFLLCTSRSFVPNLGGSEYVWKYLCQSKWKYTLEMDESFLQSVGYQSLFRKLSRRALLRREQDHPQRELAAFLSTSPQQQWPPLPPPKLKMEHLQLFFSLRSNGKSGNRELVSTKLSHAHLVQLVEQGQVRVSLLDKNNVTSSSPSSSASPIRIALPMGGGGTTAGEPAALLESHVGDWTATLHLIRLDTNQICGINKADAVSVDGQKEIKFLSQWLPLTNKGRDELERRIQVHDVEHGETYLGISCQVQIPLRRVVVVEQQHKNKNKQEFLQLDQIQLQVRRRHGRFPSALLDARQEAQRRHGVTLLHLWNELQGWDLE